MSKLIMINKTQSVIFKDSNTLKGILVRESFG